MFERIKLSTGLRLILAPLEKSKVVNVLVLVKVGSRYESKKFQGLSHLMEHMFFKGTKKRKNSLILSSAIDGLGAETNAFTAKEYTGYYLKAEAGYFLEILDILTDILLNSTFPTEEIKKEKKVIVEEIKMYEENPIMYLDDFYDKLIYQNHELGASIGGSRQSVLALTRIDIKKWQNNFYAPNNTVVVVSGKLPTNTEELVNQYFSKYKKELINFNKFSPFVWQQTEPKVALCQRKIKQAQLSLGFPAIGYNDSVNYPAINLLNIILGGNMSSRLFVNIREKRGLAYSIGSSLTRHQDCGDLAIQAGVDVSQVKRTIKVILDEVEKIKIKGICEKELTNAKKFLKGKFALNFEDVGNLALWYGKAELLTQNIGTPEEKLKEFMAVSLDEVNNLASKIFDWQKINLALIGNFPSQEKNFFLNLLKKQD